MAERRNGAGSAAVHGSSSGAEGRRPTDDLLVVESHSVEDLPEVVVGLRGVRKSTVGRRLVLISVDASGPPGNLVRAERIWRSVSCAQTTRSGPRWPSVKTHVRSPHLLDGCDSSERPQVSVRDPVKVLLDLLHVVSGLVESVVGAVLHVAR